VLPPHQLASLSARLPALWPPSPYTLASAGARVAEALALGTRRRYTCFAPIDVTGAGRGLIAAVPVEIVRGGIGRTLEPALSRHERTMFENGLRW
jgi:malate/lactate dehydrogenase